MNCQAAQPARLNVFPEKHVATLPRRSPMNSLRSNMLPLRPVHNLPTEVMVLICTAWTLKNTVDVL
jgi:hypothetical protein